MRTLCRSAARNGVGQDIVDLADALGMANRQAAEAKATRLERAAESHRSDRDVRAQRSERARRRTVEAWCRDHEARIKAVSGRLVEVAGAWPELAEDTAAAVYLDLLSEATDGVRRVECLEMLHWRIVIRAARAVEPPLGPVLPKPRGHEWRPRRGWFTRAGAPRTRQACEPSPRGSGVP